MDNIIHDRNGTKRLRVHSPITRWSSMNKRGAYSCNKTRLPGRKFLSDAPLFVSVQSSSWPTAHAWVGGVVWWTLTFIYEFPSYLGPFVSVCLVPARKIYVHCAYCVPESFLKSWHMPTPHATPHATHSCVLCTGYKLEGFCWVHTTVQSWVTASRTQAETNKRKDSENDSATL